MHQNGESVVEVQKALSVDVSQIGAFALQRAARLRIAQPQRAWCHREKWRPRANNLADWRQAARSFVQYVRPLLEGSGPTPLSSLTTWRLHLVDVIHEMGGG